MRKQAVEDVLGRWLEEQPSVAPARIVDRVIAELPRTRQQRSWRAAVTIPSIGWAGRGRVMALAAVLGVLAVVAYALGPRLPAFAPGASRGPTNAPATATPRATSHPSGPASLSPRASVVESVLDLSGALSISDIAGIDLREGALVTQASRDAVWVSGGIPAVLVRVDTLTGVAALVEPPDGVELRAFALDDDELWGLGIDSEGMLLMRRTQAADGDWATTRLSLDPWNVAVAADGSLWAATADGAARLSAAGEVMRTYDTPFEQTFASGFPAHIDVPPAFGALWAHDSANLRLHRIDVDSAEVTAVDLTGCPTPNAGHGLPTHPGLIYPLDGVQGMLATVVVSCAMNADHEYPGSMLLIDPTNGALVGTAFAGEAYGRGAVVGGEWWVPVGVSTAYSTQPGHLVRLDPAARTPSARVTFQQPARPIALVSTGDALWATVFTGDELSNVALVRIGS